MLWLKRITMYYFLLSCELTWLMWVVLLCVTLSGVSYLAVFSWQVG